MIENATHYEPSKKNLRKETKETKHYFFIWLLISDQVCHKKVDGMKVIIKTKSIEYFFIIKKSVTVGIFCLPKQLRWASPMGERFDRFYQTLVK